VVQTTPKRKMKVNKGLLFGFMEGYQKEDVAAEGDKGKSRKLSTPVEKKGEWGDRGPQRKGECRTGEKRMEKGLEEQGGRVGQGLVNLKEEF